MKEKKKIVDLMDNLNTIAGLAPLSTTNYKSTKGSTTARDRDSVANMSISLGNHQKRFTTRNRSVIAHTDHKPMMRKHSIGGEIESPINLSKNQFRRNILSNIFSNQQHQGRNTSLSGANQDD